MKPAVEKVKSLIERHGTLTEDVKELGKLKLSYPIKKGTDVSTEGYYVIYSFTSAPEFPAELNRRLNINDNVLRALVTTK